MTEYTFICLRLLESAYAENCWENEEVIEILEWIVYLQKKETKWRDFVMNVVDYEHLKMYFSALSDRDTGMILDYIKCYLDIASSEEGE